MAVTHCLYQTALSFLSRDEVTLLFFLNCDDSPNPYLYKTHRISGDSADSGYTKDNLSKIIEDTILDIGLNKVVAFMSDLTAEMEGTWEILRGNNLMLCRFDTYELLETWLTLENIIIKLASDKPLLNLYLDFR